MLFVFLLAWNFYFLYGTWYSPHGHRYVSFIYRLCALAGLSTLLLFYLSGLYNDTLVQPRKFVPQANRALRHYNVKLVITNRGWLRMFKVAKPGEGLRLIVSSKAGTMQFREAFEQYRDEYWSEAQKQASQAPSSTKNRSSSTAHRPHKQSHAHHA